MPFALQPSPRPPPVYVLTVRPATCSECFHPVSAPPYGRREPGEALARKNPPAGRRWSMLHRSMPRDATSELPPSPAEPRTERRVFGLSFSLVPPPSRSERVQLVGPSLRESNNDDNQAIHSHQSGESLGALFQAPRHVRQCDKNPRGCFPSLSLSWSS